MYRKESSEFERLPSLWSQRIPSKEAVASSRRGSKADVEEEAPEACLEVIEVWTQEGNDGLTLDICACGLLILDIGEGAVLEHNNRVARLSQQVRVHDLIIGMNGDTTDPAKMLSTVANGQECTLEILHPRESIIVVDKVTGKLGLNLRYTPGSSFMEVLDIGPGDVQAHNRRAPLDELPVGALIVAVNGKTGSIMKLMPQLRLNDAQITFKLLTINGAVEYLQPLKRISV